MKKVLAIVFVCFLSTLLVSAQRVDERAQGILNGVSQKTKSHSSMKIDFEMKIENKVDKTSSSQNGVLIVKGSKFKLEISGTDLYCNGNTVWSYIEETNEVQINEYEEDEDAISPNSILTIWEKDFRSKFITEKTVDGVLTQVIDLLPNDGDKSYYKIQLFIDKAKKQLIKAVIYEREGQEITYKIKSQKVNLSLTDAFFVFDKTKYPGVYVEDLR